MVVLLHCIISTHQTYKGFTHQTYKVLYQNSYQKVVRLLFLIRSVSILALLRTIRIDRRSTNQIAAFSKLIRSDADFASAIICLRGNRSTVRHQHLSVSIWPRIYPWAILRASLMPIPSSSFVLNSRRLVLSSCPALDSQCCSKIATWVRDWW